MQNIILMFSISLSMQFLQTLKLIIELNDLHFCEKTIAEKINSKNRFSHYKSNIVFSYYVQMNKFKIAEFFVSKKISDVFVTHEFILFHFAMQWNYIEFLKIFLQKHFSKLFRNLLFLHFMHIAIFVFVKKCVKFMLNHKFRKTVFVLNNFSILNKTVNYTKNLSLYNVSIIYTKHAIIFLINVLINEFLNSQWKKHFVENHFWNDAASCTFLYFAVFVENRDNANVFLTTNNRFDVTNSRYDTALHIAIKNKNCAVTKILLNFDANIFIRNICLKTFFMIIAAKNHLRILQILSKQNIDFETRNFENETILHLTTKSNNIKCFVYILNIMQNFDFETKCEQRFFIFELIFACNKNKMSFLLNLKFNSRLNVFHQINILTAAILNHNMTI